MRSQPVAKSLYFTIFPAGLVLVAIAAFSAIQQVPVSDITRDPTAIANVHPLTGFLSNLGILLWCATASICLFASAVVSGNGERRTRSFLFFAFVLSAYLLLDDLFLIHESLAHRYLGVGEKTVILLSGLSLLAFLFVFRTEILSTNYMMLLIALVMFASSVIVDYFSVRALSGFERWVHLFEDGFKWMGIASWCGYFSRTSFDLVVRRLQGSEQP
jgi:hypothetical protein